MMTGGGAEKTVGSLGGGCGDWRGRGGLSHDLNSPVWKSPYFLFFLFYPFFSRTLTNTSAANICTTGSCALRSILHDYHKSEGSIGMPREPIW